MRHTEITRRRLLDDDRLAVCEVLVVCAPAGYGKSTLGIQWATRFARTMAWATLDESDNDPIVLLNTVSAALAHATSTFVPLAQVTADEPVFTRVVVPAFARAVAALDEPLTMVFDDVHVVADPAAQKVLRTLVDALPIGSQVAFVGRSMSAIPLALWRGQGRVVEVHSEDLAFTVEETAMAFEGFGRDEGSEDVHQATGGWPVAVFLLSQTPTAQSLTNVAEFIESEVLAPMSPELRHFVMCTAALGTVDTELANAVSGSDLAAHFLSETVTTVLITPGEQGWYRYHPLMQDAVLDVWRRSNPSGLAQVQATAARWYLYRGMLDTAVTNALASGDGATLGPVVWAATKVALLQGRTRTVMGWLERIDERTISMEPELSMSAAWTNVTACHYGSVLRHLEQTLALMPSDWRDHIGDFSIGSELATLLAISHFGVQETGEALELAASGRALVSPTDPIYPLVTLTLAVNQALAGMPGAATLMNDAAEMAHAGGIASTEIEGLALLGILLMGHGHETEGCEAIERALSIYAFHDLGQMTTTTGIVLLAKVALTSLRGRQADIPAAMAQQASVSTEVESILGWYRSLSGGILAYASMRAGDHRACREYISWCRGEAMCRLWVDKAEQEYAAATPLTQLTPAELRVWSLLKSRMTLNEIAGSLFLSRETVKSHTGSIYRKLGVASRREAQELAETWG